MLSLRFVVADMPYVIQFEDDLVDYRYMLPSHGRFVDHNEENAPKMSLYVGQEYGVEAPEGLMRVGEFPSGDSSYDVYRDADGTYFIRIIDLLGEVVCVFSASPDFSKCKASLFGDNVHKRFGLQNCIMVCYAFCGAYHNILMMHSSVIKRNGYGYLFLGKSGTGKSTHSRLWLENIPGCELLNDDNPAVRLMDDGTVRVYGTPWSGKTPCYRQEWAEVGGFLRLHQAPHNVIKTMAPLESFANILSSCSSMVWDEASYNGICNTITSICNRVQSYDLECLPNAEAAQMSSGAMIKD